MFYNNYTLPEKCIYSTTERYYLSYYHNAVNFRKLLEACQDENVTKCKRHDVT